jgi:polyisoprenoid-binding protein YceI
MKSFITLLIFSCVLSANAQLFIPVDDGSRVKFKVKNVGLVVEGTLTGLEGKIQFDQANISSAKFDVSIDANSIDTGIQMRDNHMRRKEYLDVKTYPRIHFASSKIQADKAGQLIVSGHLTIKSVTKEISFPYRYSIVKGAPSFEGEFGINRRDFNVGGGSLTMADNLIVYLDVRTK